MKKLGQKLSFLTKIMIVVGLLISNLSSLSVVFAYEGTQSLLVTLNEKVLEISYLEQLPEDVEKVEVKVYENYTYLNNEPEEEIKGVYTLTSEELLAAKEEGKLELSYDSMFVGEEKDNFKYFDGTYNARVEVVGFVPVEETTEETNPEETEVMATEVLNTEEEETTPEYESVVLADAEYEEVMTHASGLNIKLFNLNDEEITPVSGRYPVAVGNYKVKVVATVLSGGLNPTDVFEHNGVRYEAPELIEKGFSSEVDFTGLLYGEYELPVEVRLLKPLAEIETTPEETPEEVALEVANEIEETVANYETVVYADTIKVLYGTYETNAEILNDVADVEGYGETYEFYSDDKDGVLYLLLDLDEVAAVSEDEVVTRSVLDLYNIVSKAVDAPEGVESTITYTILKDGVDVLEGFAPVSEEDTLDAYLATVKLDDTVELVMSCEGLTITYKVVVLGDLNNDETLSQEDVLLMIDQVVGKTEVTNVEKSDVADKNGKVETLDVLVLNQMVNTKSWLVDYEELDAKLDAMLEVKFNGENLSEENYLISGDEFTVDYVLSLTDYEVNGVAGLFQYDKELFELVSVKTNFEWLGNNHDGKFLYLGEESLTGPELEEATPETNVPETVVEGEVAPEEDTVTPVDYVVVTATFRALKATEEGVITLEGIELFNSTENSAQYYVLDQDELTTETIAVKASDNNKLSSLVVAGQVIELVEDVYEYEITVGNDVTAADVVAELEHIAARIASIVYPEELVEGENEVVITVVSESGIEQVYTVKVTREAAPEETTRPVDYDNYYGDYEDKEEEVIVTEPEEPAEEPKEEKDGTLSRIIIIILILLVIAGLIYLIFKDEDDDTKKANKEINKLRKENNDFATKNVKENNKPEHKPNNGSKNKGSHNKKKER